MEIRTFYPPFDDYKLQRLKYEIESGRKVKVFPKDEPDGAGVDLFMYALKREVMSWELPLLLDLIKKSDFDFVSVETK